MGSLEDRKRSNAIWATILLLSFFCLYSTSLTSIADCELLTSWAIFMRIIRRVKEENWKRWGYCFPNCNPELTGAFRYPSSWKYYIEILWFTVSYSTGDYICKSYDFVIIFSKCLPGPFRTLERNDFYLQLNTAKKKVRLCKDVDARKQNALEGIMLKLMSWKRRVSTGTSMFSFNTYLSWELLVISFRPNIDIEMNC